MSQYKCYLSDITNIKPRATEYKQKKKVRKHVYKQYLRSSVVDVPKKTNQRRKTEPVEGHNALEGQGTEEATPFLSQNGPGDDAERPHWQPVGYDADLEEQQKQTTIGQITQGPVANIFMPNLTNVTKQTGPGPGENMMGHQAVQGHSVEVGLNPKSLQVTEQTGPGDGEDMMGRHSHQAVQGHSVEERLNTNSLQTWPGDGELDPEGLQAGPGQEEDMMGHPSHQTVQGHREEERPPNPNPLQDGDDLLYPGAPITKGQSLLLLMSYVLRHNLTGIALDHLLQIFHEHFPGLMPATSYLFHKSYGEYGEYEPHFYCQNCLNYIGTKECGLTQCAVCRSTFDVNNNLKKGLYFLVVSLSSQLKAILETLDTSKHTSAPGVICDIQCGGEYRKLKDSGEIGDGDISLLWNCDGIPVFKSSNCQIWPIQCQIIELQPADRKNNICVPCLWFGESKPNIQALLTPFVNELEKLQTHGFTWANGRTTKVHALVCSSDSVARPLLRNTKQFNGMYGCDFCYQIGGGPYPFSPNVCLRTETEHFENAMNATPQQPVMGVKGPSELMRLNNFQMIKGFVPEYQHSVCLGVIRQMATLWLDSTNHEHDWYIGTKTEQIDAELLAIFPPTEITRVPRSIKERKFWKASEWRSFLLFYALPALNGILPRKYWNHLFLLVFAVYHLLQEQISEDDVDKAEQALTQFVREFEGLYGTSHCSFNVHLMTHLAASVRNWGPLWATSTFSFESFNGTLLHYFNGTTHVPAQIMKRFLRCRSLTKKGATVMVNANDDVKDLFSELQCSKCFTERSLQISEHVRVFGKSVEKDVSVLHTLAIEALLDVRVRKAYYYNRFIVNGILYHSDNYSRLQKRKNSVVQLHDGTFVRILSLVVSGAINCILVKELLKSGRRLCRDATLKIASNFIHEVSECNSVYAIHPESLKRKSIMINSREKVYVIPLPNNIERD